MWLEIEFDWDEENRKHLAVHKVTTAEVEHVLTNDPLDLDYELVDNEERYRSVGLTSGGRVLSVAWTIRNGKVRPITAFPSGVADRKAFLKKKST
ncbi:MAG: BrnT family toxin [Bryobacteraceae bacterium]